MGSGSAPVAANKTSWTRSQNKDISSLSKVSTRKSSKMQIKDIKLTKVETPIKKKTGKSPSKGSLKEDDKRKIVETGSPVKPKRSTKNTDTKVVDKSRAEDHKFECQYCQKGFKRKYDMEKHARKHTGVKPYKCGICGKQFVQVGSLSVHMRSHTGEEPYKCEICNKGFAVKERLRLHSRTHTGEKPYACDQCDKKFARGGQLLVHKRTHSGDKPYSCPTCELKFNSSGNLKTHMKLHAGSKDYQCHLCDKAYPRADTLKRHILAFHENKRLYKCDVCGKSFKGHIRDHMRTHAEDREGKPYGCHQCGARFNQRSQLTVHMRVHTGERPYSCKICKRSFSHSTALKLHLRMHTGEKPHVCKLCKKPFAQLPHLKKHMLCVHNTDRPYYCEVCEAFYKVKSDYQEHVDKNHPGQVPEDLVGVSDVITVDATLEEDDIAEMEVEETGNTATSMPMEKMRTLLALLLKKISTPGRLKKLGFGARLIDDVLKESITASGRKPVFEGKDMTERDILNANIQILLDWTIPDEYMNFFKAEKKTVEEILEELAA